MAGKRIDDEIRKMVTRDFKKGFSRAKIAEKYSISRSSVGRIVKEKAGRQVGPKPGQDNRRTERQKKIEDLERRVIALEKRILEMDRRRG